VGAVGSQVGAADEPDAVVLFVVAQKAQLRVLDGHLGVQHLHVPVAHRVQLVGQAHEVRQLGGGHGLGHGPHGLR
jgi:hypothetical protein